MGVVCIDCRLPVLILQKRVVPFFVADGGAAAVAGQHYGVFRQHQQFLADIVQQIGMAAAFEIGATNGFVEQHVAGMVEVAVGKPDGFGLHAELGGFFQQLRHVAAHVYPHGFFAFFVPQERTVLAEGGDGEHGKVERHGRLSL